MVIILEVKTKNRRGSYFKSTVTDYMNFYLDYSQSAQFSFVHSLLPLEFAQ